jgi:hypothetical protein
MSAAQRVGGTERQCTCLSAPGRRGSWRASCPAPRLRWRAVAEVEKLSDVDCGIGVFDACVSEWRRPRFHLGRRSSAELRRPTRGPWGTLGSAWDGGGPTRGVCAGSITSGSRRRDSLSSSTLVGAVQRESDSCRVRKRIAHGRASRNLYQRVEPRSGRNLDVHAAGAQQLLRVVRFEPARAAHRTNVCGGRGGEPVDIAGHTERCTASFAHKHRVARRPCCRRSSDRAKII